MRFITCGHRVFEIGHQEIIGKDRGAIVKRGLLRCDICPFDTEKNGWYVIIYNDVVIPVPTTYLPN